jgi:hypothetical protein
MTYSISTPVAVLWMHTWALATVAGFIATGAMEKIASVAIGFESRIRKRRTSLAIQWENDRSIEDAVPSDSSTSPSFGWA